MRDFIGRPSRRSVERAMPRLRILSTLFVAALGGLPIASAQPKPAPPVAVDPAIAALKLSPAGTKAVKTLVEVKVFAGWAVGVAAAPTPGVSALRVLVTEPNAAAALAYVRANATIEGQLMALAGLYDVDPAAFKRALPAYVAIKDSVRVWETGCMMGPSRTVASIAHSKDAVQTGGAGKPLPRNGMVLDLAGGGYSAAMRERVTKTP